MAAGEYDISPRSHVHLSVYLPELSLIFQQPRCFLVSSLAVIWSSSVIPHGSKCVTIIAHTLVTSGLEITCHSFTTFMCVWVCERSVRRQCVLQCQGLCFLWLPISCPLFSTSPWLSRTHACAFTHLSTHTHKESERQRQTHRKREQCVCFVCCSIWIEIDDDVVPLTFSDMRKCWDESLDFYSFLTLTYSVLSHLNILSDSFGD